MLLSLFIIITSVSLFLIGLSYYSKEALYSLAGFFLLFLLSSSILIPQSLEIKNGETKNVTFTYINSTLTSQNELTNYNYSSPTSRSYGVWLTIISIFGIAITIYEIKQGKGL